MIEWASIILVYAVVYLVTAIPFGYYLGLIYGKDLTELGSKSIGATNVLRVLGKWQAILVLTLDITKGFLPLFLVTNFFWEIIPRESYLFLFLTIVPLIGHGKSLYIGFKGGKSSATGFGVLLAINPLVALITILIWIVTVKLSEYSSLGSIICIPLVPIWLYLFGEPLNIIIFGVIAFVYIVLIKHSTNIKRLLSGTEPKVGQNQKDA
jgi:glycerol-3-phosphate acyltransferase PlsY